jgi:hypothetical protein
VTPDRRFAILFIIPKRETNPNRRSFVWAEIVGADAQHHKGNFASGHLNCHIGMLTGSDEGASGCPMFG